MSLEDRDLEAGVFLERPPGEVAKWKMRLEVDQAHLSGLRMWGRREEEAPSIPAAISPPRCCPPGWGPRQGVSQAGQGSHSSPPLLPGLRVREV